MNAQPLAGTGGEEPAVPADGMTAWPGEADDDAPEPLEAERVDTPAQARSLAAALDDAELAALVLRVCDQHEPSLARLYEATAGRVHGFALRVLRQAAAAEEVVEDVYWQVWREAPRFDAGRGNVMAWLLAIARSRTIDALRRRERVRAHEQATDDDEALAQAAERAGSADALALAAGPDELVAASQHHAALHALLAALEPLPRQLLALAFFRGCSHEEIAEQTGLALGTVKSHIRRTLIALRAQLAPTLSHLERSAP